MSSPVVQQLDGMEGAGPDALPASGSAFHLANLWPVIAWPPQRCRVCHGYVEQADAIPYTKPGCQGWQHWPGECAVETITTGGLL